MIFTYLCSGSVLDLLSEEKDEKGTRVEFPDCPAAVLFRQRFERHRHWSHRPGRHRNGNESEDLPLPFFCSRVSRVRPKSTERLLLMNQTIGTDSFLLNDEKTIRNVATTKKCPRCGALFVCRHGEIEKCHCTAVTLSPTQREWLRKKYVDCLCAECLKEIVRLPSTPDMQPDETVNPIKNITQKTI